MGEVHYQMTQKQLNRNTVISNTINGLMTISEAAITLGLSERQVKRLKKGVQLYGSAFLIHKNKGRSPIHSISDQLANQIVSLKKSDLYKDANFLHFQELLLEYEGISISYSALHSLLTTYGLKSPKKHRKDKKHHRRKRKPQEGLLIQIDATPFEWFGGTKKLALHGSIDDASGKITGLYLSKNECLQGYFEVLRQTLTNHGIPVSIYADRHTIFRSPKADKLSVEEQLSGKLVNDTQFGRAMKEFGIHIIAARSPQAKGRIERLWDTLQSRLPIEFKLAGITTIAQANEFLKSYIVTFNEKFAVVADDATSAFRSISDTSMITYALCVKQNRTLDNGAIFSFYNRYFQVNDNHSIPVKAKIQVMVSPSFGLKVQYKGSVYDVVPFIKPKRQQSAMQKRADSSKSYTPPDDHYFKRGKELWSSLSFEDSNLDILRMLEDIFLKKQA